MVYPHSTSSACTQELIGPEKAPDEPGGMADCRGLPAGMSERPGPCKIVKDDEQTGGGGVGTGIITSKNPVKVKELAKMFGGVTGRSCSTTPTKVRIENPSTKPCVISRSDRCLTHRCKMEEVKVKGRVLFKDDKGDVCFTMGEGVSG